MVQEKQTDHNETVMKLIFILFACCVSQISYACPACGPHHSPMDEIKPFLEEIVYFDNNPQMCADDFVTFLRKEVADARENAKKKTGPAAESAWAEADRIARRNALWEEALRIAKRNVRKLECNDGRKGNVVFINKKVFLTNAHAFYTEDRDGYLVDKQTTQYIHRCYVMNGSKKNYIDINNPPDFGDPTVNSGEDYAVGAVENAIEDIAPIEMAKPQDISKDQDIMVASAFRNNVVGENCFSAAVCFDRKIWPSKDDLASSHATNCPSDDGGSGSGGFLVDQSGKIALGHLERGGTDPNAPNGRPYYYTKDLKDPRAAYSDRIGVDGVYRDKIDLFVKKIEAQNPPSSLVPRPLSRDAKYEPDGQSL